MKNFAPPVMLPCLFSQYILIFLRPLIDQLWFVQIWKFHPLALSHSIFNAVAIYNAITSRKRLFDIRIDARFIVTLLSCTLVAHSLIIGGIKSSYCLISFAIFVGWPAFEYTDNNPKGRLRLATLTAALLVGSVALESITGPLAGLWAKGYSDIAWQHWGYFFFKLDIAKYCVVVCFLLFSNIYETGSINKWGGAVYITCLGVAVVSYHRVSVFLCFFILFFCVIMHQRFRKFIGTGATWLIVSFVLLLAILAATSFFVIDQLSDGSKFTLTGRSDIWRTYFGIFSGFDAQEFLLGSGDKHESVVSSNLDVSSEDTWSYHNMYIAIFSIYGVFGVIVVPLIFLFSILSSSSSTCFRLIYISVLLCYGMTTEVINNFSHITTLAIPLLFAPKQKTIANNRINTWSPSK